MWGHPHVGTGALAQRLTVPSLTRARGWRESREDVGPLPACGPPPAGVWPGLWGRHIPAIPAAPAGGMARWCGTAIFPLFPQPPLVARAQRPDARPWRGALSCPWP